MRRIRFEAGSTTGAGRTGSVVEVDAVDEVDGATLVDVDGVPGTVGAIGAGAGRVTGGGVGSVTAHDAMTISPFLFT